MLGSNDLTLTPLEIEPAEVVAYNTTVDTSKVEELIRRNHILFPLFLDNRPLKISN